jgi:hypothetical protein
MYINIIIFLVFLSSLYFLINNKIDSWCNTYSGWPGPLEMASCGKNYNIPALQGGKSIGCHYTYTPNSNSNYLKMKNLPQ